MNTKEFEKEAEDFIYKEIAKNTNLLLGKSKTASLSTGLFLKLPVELSVVKAINPLPKLTTPLASFIRYFAAYTNMRDNTKVFFKILYNDEKQLPAILKNLRRHGVFFAFVYLHEVQHILRRHLTKSYNDMMLRIAVDHPQPHQIVNIAEDHAINYSIKDLFNLTNNQTLTKAWDEIEAIGLYSPDYHKQQLSDIEILKDLLKDPPKMSSQPSADGLEEVDCDGTKSNQPVEGKASGDSDENGNGKSDKCDTSSDEADISLADLADSMQEIIESNTKGSAAGELFEKLFDSIKVETGWFKKIKASFKRQVYYMTHDYSSSWANLNNTYRRIYKAPKKTFFDNKIEIILSVDHSGSMSTEALQKLLYLIESEGKQISSLTVIIHDYVVTKVFEVASEYDISKAEGFKEALATRYSAGGTSHDCVFQHIQDMKLPDPNKVIYLSFSDNYSDIEKTINNYPIMRKVTKYWVSPVHNPVNVAGTNITMV